MWLEGNSSWATECCELSASSHKVENEQGEVHLSKRGSGLLRLKDSESQTRIPFGATSRSSGSHSEMEN